MRIRISSWHIAAFGFFIQFAIGYFLLSKAPYMFKGFAGAVFGIVGLALIGGSLIALIPLPFLFFKRTRKIGAFISLLVGILGMLFPITRIASIFITVAGVFEIWEQKKIKK